jgi:hypothetical protein
MTSAAQSAHIPRPKHSDASVPLFAETRRSPTASSRRYLNATLPRARSTVRVRQRADQPSRPSARIAQPSKQSGVSHSGATAGLLLSCSPAAAAPVTLTGAAAINVHARHWPGTARNGIVGHHHTDCHIAFGGRRPLLRSPLTARSSARRCRHDDALCVRGDRARLPRPSGGWPSADATCNDSYASARYPATAAPGQPIRDGSASVYRSISAAESPQHVQVRWRRVVARHGTAGESEQHTRAALGDERRFRAVLQVHRRGTIAPRYHFVPSRAWARFGGRRMRAMRCCQCLWRGVRVRIFVAFT